MPRKHNHLARLEAVDEGEEERALQLVPPTHTHTHSLSLPSGDG